MHDHAHMTPHALTQVLIALARGYHSTRKLTTLISRWRRSRSSFKYERSLTPKTFSLKDVQSRDGVDQGAKGLKAKCQGLTPFIVPLVLEDLFRGDRRGTCLQACVNRTEGTRRMQFDDSPCLWLLVLGYISWTTEQGRLPSPYPSLHHPPSV
jgi:hypothetical protein